jgi:membrane protease subunit HflK
MREVVGRTALDPILTNGRGRVQDETRVLMQKVLDSYGAGITVNEVQIRNAGPPPDVVDAFRDVASAKQDAQSLANQARAGQAKIVQDALGYKAQVVQEAEGEAARFNQVYAQYKLAPPVTRQRLYIETMERVLKNSKKVIVDSKGASAPIILPPDAFRPKEAPAAGSRPMNRNNCLARQSSSRRLADRGDEHLLRGRSDPSGDRACAWASPCGWSTPPATGDTPD